MKSVLIMNQGRAEKYTSDNPYVVISITDHNKPDANFVNDDNRKELLRLKFDDIEKKIDDIAFYEDMYLMDSNDAITIKNFVEKYKDDIDHLIVHCWAGVSRSAGIAFAIRRHYFNDDPKRMFGINEYAPNLLCYKLMMRVFGKEEEVNEKMLRDINSEC